MQTNEIAKETLQIDWSTVIAGIAFLVAIVSPLLTSIINNRHQLKLKNLEFNQTKRISAFENYLKCAAICVNSEEAADVHNYQSARGELYLYVDKVLRKEIDTKNCFFIDNDFDEFSRKSAYQEIAGLVADYYASIAKQIS